MVWNHAIPFRFKMSRKKTDRIDGILPTILGFENPGGEISCSRWDRMRALQSLEYEDGQRENGPNLSTLDYYETVVIDGMQSLTRSVLKVKYDYAFSKVEL